MKRIFLVIMMVVLGPSQIRAASDQPALSVSVIAPSISTSIMARRIIAEMKWIEAKPKKADQILVVVRSSLLDPLNINYKSYHELERDADMQLNISGPKYQGDRRHCIRF